MIVSFSALSFQVSLLSSLRFPYPFLCKISCSLLEVFLFFPEGFCCFLLEVFLPFDLRFLYILLKRLLLTFFFKDFCRLMEVFSWTFIPDFFAISNEVSPLSPASGFLFPPGRFACRLIWGFSAFLVWGFPTLTNKVSPCLLHSAYRFICRSLEPGTIETQFWQ